MKLVDPKLGTYSKWAESCTQNVPHAKSKVGISGPNFKSSEESSTELEVTIEGREEKEEPNTVFEPDLVFMFNDGRNTIQEGLSSTDKYDWIKVINTKRESLEDHGTWSAIKHGSLPTQVRRISSRMIGEIEPRWTCSLIQSETHSTRILQKTQNWFGQ